MLAHPPHRRDVAVRPHHRQQTRCRRRLRWDARATLFLQPGDFVVLAYGGKMTTRR